MIIFALPCADASKRDRMHVFRSLDGLCTILPGNPRPPLYDVLGVPVRSEHGTA